MTANSVTMRGFSRSFISPLHLFIATLITLSIIAFSLYRQHYGHSILPHFPSADSVAQLPANLSDVLRHAISTDLQYYKDYPLEDADIGERGTRTEALREWIAALDDLDSKARQEMRQEIDEALVSLYPFLVHPSREAPYLSSWRHRVVPGSRGIVIVVAKKFFRMAAHAIGNIRDAMGSSLPIVVAYAGDNDLPKEYRDALISLGPDISSFDILSAFDNDIIDITHGDRWGWSTKAFAVLGSTFEKVILLDADAILLQKPEVIFDSHRGFRSTGALFFRDRLIWKDFGNVDRRKWFHTLLGPRKPSEALLSSKVFSEGAGHEVESGLVALDMGRLDTFMGMLHTCWANTRSIREEFTYKMTFGDKESWMFGQELTGSPYTMEAHYGAILGTRNTSTFEGQQAEGVCGSVIMHVDENDELLWHNGGLLTDKKKDKNHFEAHEWWMWDDGKWSKQHNFLCMFLGEVRAVPDKPKAALDRSIKRAKELDEQLKDLIDLSRLK